MLRRIICGAALAGLLATVGLPAAAQEPGTWAPEVKAKEWLNSSTPVSWQTLKGKVLLVELWSKY